MKILPSDCQGMMTQENLGAWDGQHNNIGALHVKSKVDLSVIHGCLFGKVVTNANVKSLELKEQ